VSENDVPLIDESEDEEEVEIPTDEPEEIPPSEADKSTIIEEGLPDQDAGHLTELVCDVCLELNLTTKSSIECKRCGKAFCFHYASSIDPDYCVNCMSEVSVTKQIITKTYEHKNEETGQSTFYRRKAREIKIEGLDWLFAQRKIKDLSDVELDLMIEYHRNICSLITAESERRRNEKMHRYAGKHIVIPTPATTVVTSNTTTTVKKSRTVSKAKATEQLAAVLQSLLAKGMSVDQIAKMMGSK
jgi:hypothetical protein